MRETERVREKKKEREIERDKEREKKEMERESERERKKERQTGRTTLSKLKCLHLSFNKTLSLFSLGLLITFVNTFHFNLVVMFVYFVNQSSI